MEPEIPSGTGALDTEPVAALLALAVVVIDAGIAMATALDWVFLSDGQATSIAAFVTAVTAAIGAFVRSRVFSPATVTRLVAPGAGGGLGRDLP